MRSLTTSLLIFSCYLTSGQLIDKSKFDRLVIVDEFNYNFGIIYGRVYKLNIHDSLPNLILTREYKSSGELHPIYRGRIPDWDKARNRNPNQFIRQINPQLVDELIQTINNPASIKSLLAFYKIDSIWHLKNKKRLVKQFTEENKRIDKLEVSYAGYLLNDYNQFQRLAYSSVLQTNTSGYSNVTVAFENDTDTLLVHSTGQESFLIPLRSDTTYKSYDVNLSSLISQFLPDDFIINKQTLNPSLNDFEQNMLTQLSMKVHFFNRKKFRKYLKNKAKKESN